MANDGADGAAGGEEAANEANQQQGAPQEAPPADAPAYAEKSPNNRFGRVRAAPAARRGSLGPRATANSRPKVLQP